MSIVLFMPTQKFGPVSINGVDHLEYQPGKDEQGRPYVFEIPEHQARIWQDKYGWGKIVSKQEVLINPDGSPIQPPDAKVQEPPGPEILTAPQISIAANQQPLPTAAPRQEAVQPPADAGHKKGKGK